MIFLSNFQAKRETREAAGGGQVKVQTAQSAQLCLPFTIVYRNPWSIDYSPWLKRLIRAAHTAASTAAYLANAIRSYSISAQPKIARLIWGCSCRSCHCVRGVDNRAVAIINELLLFELRVSPF